MRRLAVRQLRNLGLFLVLFFLLALLFLDGSLHLQAASGLEPPLMLSMLAVMTGGLAALALLYRRWRPSPPLRLDELQAMIDLLPAQVCVLDGEGRIVLVNREWQHFAEAAGVPLASVGVGVDYLAVCELGRRQGADGAEPVAQGIRAVMAGSPAPPTLINACHWGARRRWFQVGISGLPGWPGALVVHTEVTDALLGVEAQRLSEAAFANAGEGMAVCDSELRVLRVNEVLARLLGREDLPGNPLPLGDLDGEEPILDDQGRWRSDCALTGAGGVPVRAHVSLARVRNADEVDSLVVATVTDLSRFEAYQARIDYLAYHDEITGLPNRRHLEEVLTEAMNPLMKDRRGALVLIGMDRLQPINESLGHAIGDQVLRMAAERLRAFAEARWSLARLAGDEFALWLEGRGAGQVRLPVQSLLRLLSEPLEIAGHQLYMTASAGVACFPDDGDEPETILRAADIALAVAKQKGRNRIQFTQADMNERVEEELFLSQELVNALAMNQLRVAYQPIICLGTLGVAGVEALLRWQHPDLGEVAPDRFIPLAEDTGLIIPIGEWVLREACRQLLAWEEAGQCCPRVSVNLSVAQFRDSNLVSRIVGILAETGIPPGRLCLEVTESTLASDPELAQEVLGSLRRVGISIAVADFGTGYSSLAYLRQFPLDVLKVDRRFVARIEEDGDDAAITRAVITLARELGLKVVAEGVEMNGQLRLLRQWACSEVQGFLLARPLWGKDIDLSRLLSRLRKLLENHA